MITWNGTDFQERFNELEASGIDVHGEAKCVVELLNSLGWQFEADKWQFQADKWRLQESQEESSFRPSALVPRVLDAGCGTGRVARELARQEIEVVGVEPNESMLQVARQLSPEIRWVIADMCVIDLKESFNLVVMAGNVPLFTEPGTNKSLIAQFSTTHLIPQISPGGQKVSVSRKSRWAESPGGPKVSVSRKSRWAESPRSFYAICRTVLNEL